LVLQRRTRNAAFAVLTSDVILSNHVLDRSLDWRWRNGVDATPCETEESICSILLELRRDSIGKLNGLSSDLQTTDTDIVGSWIGC
jgi:hypothetical protein